MNVSACLVTRGDVDLSEILTTIGDAGITDIVVWDNSAERDASVFGRYRAIDRAYYDRIYVQDDDCIVEQHAIRSLLNAYTPGVITTNMPASRWGDYTDSCLVGWGAVFDRGLPSAAFDRFFAYHDSVDKDAFRRDCDVVFTTLVPHQKFDLGFRHLPWAETEGRMFRQPGHQMQRDAMLAAARAARP